MEEKQIRGRFQQKTDTPQNWEKAGNNGFVPKKGEIIVYQEAQSSEIKIGDGITNVNKLSFSKGKDGEPGPMGPQGERGPQGEQGEQGVKGDKGDKGDIGNSGVYVGSGDMPADCNVQIDPNGDTLEAEDIYGHIEDKNNPHEVTAEQIGAALQENVGTKEEAFNISLSDDVIHGYYYSVKGSLVEQDGCSRYYFCGDSDDYAALGKTLRIRTYMYGDMGVEHYSCYIEEPVMYNNSSANIESNPESGICEFEIIVPEDDYPELLISFCENPYMDAPIVYVQKDSVWDEIKKVQDGTVYEQFGAGFGCYRKTREITEFFGTAEVTMIFNNYGDGYGYMELPPSLQKCWLDVYSVINVNENHFSYGLPYINGCIGENEWGWCLWLSSKTDDLTGESIPLNEPLDVYIDFSIIIPSKPPRL